MTDWQTASPCKGSGQPWERLLGRHICPECNAGPATLRVPDDEPCVPVHPDMVIWSGRVDVTAWRVRFLAARGGGPR